MTPIIYYAIVNRILELTAELSDVTAKLSRMFLLFIARPCNSIYCKRKGYADIYFQKKSFLYTILRFKLC